MTGRAGPRTETRYCTACGRRMVWRRRWARDWEQVRHCSRACRARGVRALDRRLEGAILALLGERDPGASICPSEAARAVAVGDGWREQMEPARRAARRLAHRGAIRITQGQRVVDPSDLRGPVRLRLAPGGAGARE